MGYNQSCTFQNCTWQCCNFNGDCPQWYNNHKWQYTECYYYYGVDPTVLIWTAVCTFVGAIVILIIGCCWYREYKRKQEQIEKDLDQFEISNVTLENTQPDVVVLGRNKKPIVVSSEDKKNGIESAQVPYGQQLQMNKTAIHGIGTIINKQP